MGNSIRTVGLLNTVGAGEDHPFHYHLGSKVSIDLSERRDREILKKMSEEWTMSYTIDGSTCQLTLAKEYGGKGLLIKIQGLKPGITGDFQVYRFDLDATASDAGVQPTHSTSVNGNGSSLTISFGKQIHAGGSVTETQFFLFRTRDVRSFIVLEEKKKKEKERPHAATLAHYFASSDRINDYPRNETDVGLSVVVKIGATNGNLDVTVEGPDRHPGFGLRYLFEEAMISRIWKPTLYPHCANIQKQRSLMTRQSDSDDSESVSVARHNGGSQNNLRAVDNGGRFNGNGNGNYTEINYMFFGKLRR